MAQLTFGNGHKYRHMGMDDDDDIQVPAVETLRDRILKQCLHKQLCTTVTLPDQLANKRKFVSATEELSITACVSGLATHQHFEGVKQKFELKESLKASGLTDVEVEILLEDENPSEKSKYSSRSDLEAPHVRIERLKAIEEKLALRQKTLETEDLIPKSFSGAVTLSRKEYEEECRLVPLSKDAHELTDCLVKFEPKHDESIPAGHPINFVKQMNEELDKKIFAKNKICIRDLKRNNESYNEFEYKKKKFSNVDKTKICYLDKHPGSFWDMKAVPRIINNKHDQSVYGCSNSLKSKSKTLVVVKKAENNIKTDFTKPFVFDLEKDKLVPLEMIKKQNLNKEEILKIEKFKYYSPGEPSETLFIKNLPRKISPKELVAIFGNFEFKDQKYVEKSIEDCNIETQLSSIASSERCAVENCNESLSGTMAEKSETQFTTHRLLYRILGGRMAGQAFVTFPNKSIATQALNICNGFKICDKPMVIEFGRKK